MAIRVQSTEARVEGYVPGTWVIDPVHSDVSFAVRHMMVSKVRGHFRTFEGTITAAPDPLASTVEATVDLTSIDTKNEQRDEHVRSADFFDVARYPTMTYRSTAVRPTGDGYVLGGELTLKGVTKPLELELELHGIGRDAYGQTRAGFTATGEISRSAFGVDIHMPLDGGGVVVGDKVWITLEVSAVLQAEEA